MEDKKEEKGLCVCGTHCMCLSNKNHLWRKVFIVLALLVTFCLGAQFGEIKGELRSLRGNHYNMMRGGYGYDDFGYSGNTRGPGMMGGYMNWSKTAAPIAPTPTGAEIPKQ